MDSISPAVFWTLFAVFWAILLGAVGATAFLIGRLGSKVDWHAYEKNRSEFQEHIMGLREDVTKLLERSKHQQDLIERFMNCKLPNSSAKIGG